MLQIYLHKILPVFLLPVGIVLLLLLAGLLLQRRQVIWIGIAILWLSSTPVVSDFMVRSAEGWAERSPAINARRADAIVVLSEGRVIAPGAAQISEWRDADRFYGGVELFQAGKAPLLIFTGGWSPWQPKAKPEGKILIEYARALGVPEANMLTTGKVTNTAEEARAVASLLTQLPAVGATKLAPRHVLLVTSAIHMPRAQRLFEREGMEVTPFPVDFLVSTRESVGAGEFFPAARALEKTEIAWREMYGRMYYAVRSGL